MPIQGEGSTIFVDAVSKALLHSEQEVEQEILAMADMCVDAVKDGLQALKGSPQDSSVAFHVSGSLIRLIISALRYTFFWSLPCVQNFKQRLSAAQS